MERDRFRNSDVIFFGVLILSILLTFTFIFVNAEIAWYFSYFWIILMPIAFIKMIYRVGYRNKLINKIVKWLESSNNPVDNLINRKFDS